MMIGKTNAEGVLQYAVDQLVIQRDELRAEVERLTHLHNLDHSLADQREDECERLRAQVQALIQYGRHLPGCDQVVISDHCACGFAQARRPSDLW